MTGFAFEPRFPNLPTTLSGPLTPEQGERLGGILVSVGLSHSQADQIVRRFNESSALPDEQKGSS